jgi:hypothetical protein
MYASNPLIPCVVRRTLSRIAGPGPDITWIFDFSPTVKTDSEIGSNC